MYGLAAEDVQNIRNAIARVPLISKVILYGSRAKGNYRPGSDIDLTLLGKNLTLKNGVYPLMDALEELNLPYTFDISIYSRIDNDDLLAHIQRVGEVFYRKEVGLPEGWERASLGNVCEMIKRGVAPKYTDEGGICVINQKCIRNHKINPELSRRHNIEIKYVNPERYIKTGDVLVNSTGVGTLGRVAQVRVAPDEITTVDTHVTIVRPQSGLFYPEFFGYMLVKIEDEITSSGEGASGQTELARKTLVNKFEVTYPTSLPEQKRIVAILDKAFEGINQAVANAEKNLANGHELFESYLNTIFSRKGDGWEEKTLIDVSIEFGRGKSKHRPRNDPKLYGGAYPFVQTGDVRNSTHLIAEYSQTYNEEGLAQSKLWKRGTICITIAANIAETGILDFDACFPDSVIGIVVDETQTSNTYVEFLLQSMKARLKSKGKGSAQDNINLGTFKNEYFPFPSLDEQKQIVSVLLNLSKSVHALESIYQQKLKALTELKQSILQKAFSGELTTNTIQ